MRTIKAIMMIKNITFSLLLSTATVGAMASASHTVNKGDTLYGIASRYHTTVENIRNYNNLSSLEIHAGQRIAIPSADFSGGGKSVSAANSAVYVVRKGDSLSAIADSHRVSVSALRSHNGLRNSVIQAGQKLRIPGKSAVVKVQEVAKLSTSPQNAAGVHVVQRGESLSAIAAAYGVGLSTLARYNNLSSRRPIQVGQSIRIPAGASQFAVAKTRSVLQTSAPAQVKVSARNVRLESSSAIVIDAETGKTLYAKNSDQVRPIASITKLMTAMVALDANLALDETLTISDGDVDHLKHTGSRLPLGTKLSRYEMLRLALMSSENRAASALSRHYPGGKPAFIQAMNQKARALGMNNTSFTDSTGLTPRNVSTAEDLAKMVEAASHYDLIHKFTTTEGRKVAVRPRSAPLQYLNSNLLVRKGQWDIEVSKTGYINEAGRCLVMKADVGHRPAVMVLLDSNGKYSPVGDATRIKNWIESGAAGVTVASL